MATGTNLGAWYLASVCEGEGSRSDTVGCYEACEHQPLMPTVNDYVPDKSLITGMKEHYETSQ